MFARNKSYTNLDNVFDSIFNLLWNNYFSFTARCSTHNNTSTNHPASDKPPFVPFSFHNLSFSDLKKIFQSYSLGLVVLWGLHTNFYFFGAHREIDDICKIVTFIGSISFSIFFVRIFQKLCVHSK